MVLSKIDRSNNFLIKNDLSICLKYWIYDYYSELNRTSVK